MYKHTYGYAHARARTHAWGSVPRQMTPDRGIASYAHRLLPALLLLPASSSSPLQCTLPSQVVSRRYWTLVPTYLHISCTLLSGSGVLLICSCK